MRDCVETLARENLFHQVNNKFGIDPANFTNRERCDIIHPRDGPLGKMLEYTRRAGYVRALGNFNAVARDLNITQIYLDTIALLIANPLDFGISEEIALFPKFILRRVERFRELAIRGLPLTNEYVSEPPIRAFHNINLNDLQRLITSFYESEETLETTCARAIQYRNQQHEYVSTLSIQDKAR